MQLLPALATLHKLNSISSVVVRQLQSKSGPGAYYTGCQAYDRWTYVGSHLSLLTISLLRRPTSVAEDPTIFMTKAKVEAMLKKEKEKLSASFTDLKPLYSTELAAKCYPLEYKCPNYISLMDGWTTSGSMLCASLIPWVLMPTTQISL